jgi:hypothetical protein
VSDILDAEASGRSDIPQSFNLSIAQGVSGEAEGKSDTPLLSTIHTGVNDEAIAKADIPITETIQDAKSGEADAVATTPKVRVRTDVIRGIAKSDGSVSDQKIVADAGDSNAETNANIPIIATVNDAKSANAEAKGSKSIVTWQAGLGGTVNFGDGSGPAEGAEVHVIRDNDDTKVATTTTDSNGRWHVTVRGGKTTEPDPPVYSIEVWHREGDKRDPTATLYNATNRPFIDTADPSETDPYDKFYYGDPE